MGGSGGSSVKYGGSRNSSDECDIAFNCKIHSPIPQIVPQLITGDFLDIILVNQNNFDVLTLYTQKSGDLTGSIAAAPKIPTLVKCIKAGHTYIAEIMAIQGASISIQVRRV